MSELTVVTVKKGVKNGKNYLYFAVNGQQLKETEKQSYDHVLWGVSREITGTDYETSRGIFAHSVEEYIGFGDQRTTFPPELQLSDALPLKEYATRLKARILFARKWVGEQDFDQEESFRV